MKPHLQLHANRRSASDRDLWRGKFLRKSLSSGIVCLPLVLFLCGSKLSGENKPEAKRRSERMKNIIDRFRANLSIQEEVAISIVPQDRRLVSVKRCAEQHDTFVMSFDANFLETLDDSELTAAIAHELGHVWIFTHHPYLHTEHLANEIALKLVTRDSLEKVYAKVWKEQGTKGDISQFLGE
jgi:hypothetical protein